MAHQWKAGDLAVCVDPEGRGKRCAIPPRFRATYRVLEVTHGGRGLLFSELNPAPYDAFNAHRFRPIEPAEPSFTKAMRELRPLVEA